MALKSKELRGMTKNELLLKVEELRKQIFETGIKLVSQQLEDTSTAKRLRRDLARVITIIHEDELEIRALPKQSAAKAKPAAKADDKPKKERKK
jgi:large subunit ribosomal protein L29